MNLKNIILIVIFILYFKNIKSENITWIDTSNTLTFTNPLGWNIQKIPNITDNSVINNGAAVYEDTNYFEVRSLLLDKGSSLYLPDIEQLIGFLTMKTNSSIYFYSLASKLIDLHDSSRIKSLQISGLFYANASFYDNSQLIGSINGCTLDICYSFFSSVYLDFYNSSLIDFTDYSVAFLKISLHDYSKLKFNSIYTKLESLELKDSSSAFITLLDISSDIITVSLIDNSNLTFVNNNLLFVSSVDIYDNSFLLLNNSNIMLNQSITMYDSSRMVLDNLSKFFTYQGMVSYVRNVLILNTSDLSNKGDFYCEGDYLNVDGSFIESYFGDLHLNSTITNLLSSFVRTYSGNLHVHKKVKGLYSYFFANGGNIIIHPNSDLYFNSSTITILNGGQIYVSSLSKFILENSDIRNENGTLSTNGIITVTPGSSIFNQKEFIIQASILSTDKNSTIYLNNKGNINIKKNSNYNNTNNLLNINDDNQQILFDLNVSNYGSINIENNQNIHFKQYEQINSGSSLVFGNSTINSDSLIKINDGIVNGNGTFGNSVNQLSGQFGSNNQTISININGNYTLNQNGTILIKIANFEDFSKINISNNADLNGNIEIKVSKDLLEKTENKELNIINYSNLNSNGFNSITFKTYDPNNGDEGDHSENDCLKSKTSESSFSVLVGGCPSGSKLKGGAIAGIVIGCVVLVTLSVSLIHFRKRISNRFKQTDLGIKLFNL